jgi:pyruvate,water dikinase
MTVEILALGAAGSDDPAAVGGKAASLSRLAAGYPVPPGFALTARTLHHHAPELARGVVPAELLEGIGAAYAALGEPSVAVRSSAVDEDGDAHSFAGQHETFLNVRGLDAIAEALTHCFASAFTQRAIDYRVHVGLPVDHIGLAVLVQQLVPADVSAVAFSANPLTGSLDEVVVNACYGLGESVVGGTTTPDTFVVRKADGAILTRVVGEKHRMTVSTPTGTREIDTPALLRSSACVGDEAITEIATLATRLEQESGSPVDVECAIHDGRLYLLQSRPITTLPQPHPAER